MRADRLHQATAAGSELLQSFFLLWCFNGTRPSPPYKCNRFGDRPGSLGKEDKLYAFIQTARLMESARRRGATHATS